MLLPYFLFSCLSPQHGAIRQALLADPEVALVIQEFFADDNNKAADLAASTPPRPSRKATKASTRTGAAATATDPTGAAGVAVISDSNSLLINPALETLRLVERATKAMRWKIDSQRNSLLLQQQQQPQAPPSSSESSSSAGTSSSSSSGSSSSPIHATISYREFHVNCIALFMPLSPKRDIYMAFNSRCPHHYLSEESLQSLVRNHEQQQQQRQQRVGSSGSTGGSASARLDFIIGRVVFIEGQVATSGNAYGLAAGSKYTLLHVEEVNDKEPSQPQQQTTTTPPPSSTSRKGLIKQDGMSISDNNNNNSDKDINPSSS